MSNQVSKYMPRIMDTLLDQRLQSIGAILITGPKWCGKTRTGMFHSKSQVYIDDPLTRERALLAPESVLDGAYPRLIDEWQEVPQLWDKARRLIDDAAGRGMFIFTGSATPGQDPSHTGTGRFARLMMRPMSLYESGHSTGHVSLSGLFSGEPIIPQPSEIGIKQVIELICRGGWPASVHDPLESALEVPRDYIESIISSDITRVNGVGRNPDKVRLLLRSLARNNATTAKMTVLRNDVSEREEGEDLSLDSVRSYLDALKRIYMIDEQEAWLPGLRSKKRIRTSPKRHFIDPSLAVAALNATPGMLFEDLKTTGFLFESLCYRDLCVYAQPIRARVCHYRDNEDLEADAIIQHPDGRWGAVEVKLGRHQWDQAAVTLIRLSRKIEADGGGKPSFLMILTAVGDVAYTREDGVHIVPIGSLKD